MKTYASLAALAMDTKNVLNTAAVIRILPTGEVFVVPDTATGEVLMPKGGVDVLYVYASPEKAGIGTNIPLDHVVMGMFLDTIPKDFKVWRFVGLPAKEVTFHEISEKGHCEFTLYTEGGTVLFDDDMSPFVAAVHEGDNQDSLLLVRR